MILFEIKKLLGQRVTMLLFLLLLVINGVGTWNLDIPGIQPYSQVDVIHIRSLYKALPEDNRQALYSLQGRKEILSEAIWEGGDPGMLLTEDVYTEQQLFQTLIRRVDPVVNYSAMLQDIDYNAETLLLTGRYGENTFEYRNVIRSRQVYGELRDVEPKVLYSGGVELLPGGGITEIMTVLMGLMIALELVFSEREKGTLGLCKATFKGGFPLISGKILAGLTAGAVGTILLYGSNFLIGIIRCGPVDLSAPVQSIYGMIRCPLKVSIREYLCLFFGTKILWTASVMAIAYVASFVGRKLWQCCGVFLLIGSVCFIRGDSVLNPYDLGSTSQLFGNYRNLNILSYPVSNLTVNVMALTGILMGGFSLSVILHMKQVPSIGERNSRKRKRKLPMPMSLFRYEARKSLIMNGGAYVLLILLLVQAFVYADFPNRISPQEQLYIRYSEILAGKAGEEKDTFISQEEARFMDLYQKLESYDQGFATGKISQDSYSALTGDIYRQLEGESIFYRARDQYLLMKEQKLEYVCLTPYERLLGQEGTGEFLRQSILLSIALAVGLSGVNGTEYENGMTLLLHTTEREQESYRKKRLIGILYGLMGATIAYAPQIIAVGYFYGLPGLTASAGSVPLLKMGVGTVWFTMGTYGVILGTLSVGVSLGILLLSKWTRNTVHTCLYSLVLLLPILVAEIML